MIFTPVNNYLYVEVVETPTPEESGILLPQDYQPAENRRRNRMDRRGCIDC